MLTNFITKLNSKGNSFEIVKTNSLIPILDLLEIKGFINYLYNPYNNKFIIFNNNILLILY